MRACGSVQFLLLCNLAAWAVLAPLAWLRPCQCGEGEGKARQGREVVRPPLQPASASAASAAGTALGADLLPWEQEVLRAVEGSLRESRGPAPSAAAASSGRADLARELRAVVARRLAAAAQPQEAALVSGAAGAGNASKALGGCRPPMPPEPTAELDLPVLDVLGGKVTAAPGGPAANRWGVPMANATVEVSPGRILTLDEVIYGYDLLFEAMHLFSYVSWGRVAMQQDPADALAIADLLGRVQPDCFVELGTNTGGGAIFYAEVMRGYQPRPLVVTIDVKPPEVNWDRFVTKACPHCVPAQCHPTWQEPGLISFVKGFSQDAQVIAEVERLLAERSCQRTVVMHDSDHRRTSVAQDLQVYHRFVSPKSYLIVQDTKLSRMRGGRYQTMEAVEEFLASPAGRGRFVVDKGFEYLLFSHHHNGFLQRIA